MALTTDWFCSLFFLLLLLVQVARTQKNKATEYHLGLLKAKLAKLRTELMEGGKSSGGKGEGFDVMKVSYREGRENRATEMMGGSLAVDASGAAGRRLSAEHSPAVLLAAETCDV